MNNLHLHLILNHIPVIGVFLGILLWIAAIIMKNLELKKIVLVWFIIIAIAAIPVYFTGEAAEEAAERLPWAAESLFEQHDKSASIALMSMEILGTIALGGLVLLRKTRDISKWFSWSIFIFAIASAGLIAHAASIGGQIRHTEIRAGFQFPLSNTYAPEAQKSRENSQEESFNKEFSGTVESMPENGYNGIWVIDGREVMVTKNTLIQEKHGSAAVGAYVDVAGNLTGKIFTAFEIEIKETGK
jgi:hypothetical protein